TYAWERALLGGFKFSEIFQAYSGSPLAITAASCGTNPAQGVCLPSYNPAYNSTTARTTAKHWGQGVTRTNYNTISFINSAAFVTTPNYQFGNVPRTAPYGLTGPGNYNLDIALVRTFKLHFTQAAALDFRAEYYNVTNHTQFLLAGNSLVFGNAQFGQVAPNPAATRRSAQLSARISF
ncbi:MAG: carboxypeptidase regulatory-like domain-containing protein, partial [Bryocella sp.]